MKTLRPKLVVLLVGLACAGCGKGPVLDLVPVSGSVEHAGKPIAEASVVFHPETPLPPGTHNPLAATGPDGTFKLTTMNPGDGAPPGHYRVTVELRARRLVGEEHVRDGKHLLHESYTRPDTTPLKATIPNEATVLPPFQLR